MKRYTGDSNTRSPEIWSFVERHYAFEDKTVLDLGCGAGDMLERARRAGAGWLVGVDQDVRRAASRFLHHLNVLVIGGNIGTFLKMYPTMFDAVFCLSVLPYLPPFFDDRLRELLSYTREVLFLEVQYRADISWAGRSEWDNAAQAREALASLFGDVRCIGTTKVKGNQFERDVWLCRP